ncbi:37854_t:CDS:2, partial [Gigaspora margarita]
VGGFSSSEYLKRVREQFKRCLPYIAFPRQLEATIVKDNNALNLSATLLDDITQLYIDADDYKVIIMHGQGDNIK